MKTNRILLIFGALFVITAARAQAQDSIAVWSQRLASGTLLERAEAAGWLSMEEPTTFTAATRAAALAELERVNEAILTRTPLPGSNQLPGEGLGEYYMNLVTIVAAFDDAAVTRALVPAVAMSVGFAERIAARGDETVPLLADLIRRHYEPSAVITTLGLAWFYADSTGSPLSTESRQTILMNLLAATRSSNYSLLRGSVTALEYTGSPVFLPVAEAFLHHVRSEHSLVALALENRAIPALRAVAARLTAQQIAQQGAQSLAWLCAGATTGARRGACEAIENEWRTALEHLNAGRAIPAENVLNSIVARAMQAGRSGAFTADEETLVVGTARNVLAKL